MWSARGFTGYTVPRKPSRTRFRTIVWPIERGSREAPTTAMLRAENTASTGVAVRRGEPLGFEPATFRLRRGPSAGRYFNGRAKRVRRDSKKRKAPLGRPSARGHAGEGPLRLLAGRRVEVLQGRADLNRGGLGVLDGLRCGAGGGHHRDEGDAEVDGQAAHGRTVALGARPFRRRVDDEADLPPAHEVERVGRLAFRHAEHGLDLEAVLAQVRRRALRRAEREAAGRELGRHGDELGLVLVAHREVDG